jgi:23S rRNA A2030 N6-methylase RlmJ
LNRSKRKKPFLYLDTHAGAGRYQLSGEHAERTGEYLEGIARIWQQDDLPAELEPYIGVVNTSTVTASCATTRLAADCPPAAARAGQPAADRAAPERLPAAAL